MEHSDPPLIEVGRGVASGGSSFATGSKAARDALATISHHPVSAVLVFASVRYDLEETLAGIRSVVGEVPMFGSTTAGEICDGSYRKSVVVAALASPNLSVRLGVGQKVSTDWQRAVHEAVKAPSIRPYFFPQDNSIWNEMTQAGESAFAMVFAPGNTRHTDSRGHEVLEELKKLSLGRLPMFGGCAADDWLMEANYVFLGNRAYPDNLLVAVFRTSLKFGIGMAHGFQPSSTTVTATDVSEHEILELNGQPADEVYAEMLGGTVGSLQAKHLTLSTGKPLGIRDSYGQHTLSVASYFTARRGVRLAQPVAPGTVLTVMEPCEEEMLNAGREALLRAMLRANITYPAAIFACCCALRYRARSEQAPEEISRMNDVMPEVPLVGFYSLGEIGSNVEGVNQQNNGVITVLLLGQELSYSAQVAMENRRLTSQLEASIAELSQVQEALKGAKDKLETRVRRRTAELAVANEKLQGEIIERKRVEEELRNSLAWMTLTQDAAKAGSWEWDLRTDENFWSDEVWSLFGLEPYSHKPCYEVWTRTIHPADRPSVEQAVREASSKGIELNAEWRVMCPKGGERWLMSRARPVYEENGEPVRYIGIVMDITGRKRAEQALKESEERLRLFIEHAPTALAMFDREMRYLAVSRRWKQDYRLGDQDIIGRSHYHIFPEIPDRWKAVHRRGMEGEVVRADEDCLQRTDGSAHCLRWEVRPWYSVDGKVGGIVIFAEDITERKQAQDALRESEERFRAIIESTTDCIWVKDRSLKFTHVNPATCETLGLPASSIIGRQVKDIYGKETARQLEALDARVLKGESIEFEQARCVRGTMTMFHDTRVPLRDQSGDISGLCVISRDITERKRATCVTPISDQAYRAPAMRAALNKALLAAASDGIVLLQGESGSGKDFLAQWIHERSWRSNGPYFSINCAAVPGELAESELFGHERGSFTGALGLKKGLLELAEGGTILLNEIGELGLSLQSKLLTFLDTRSFMRVGGQRHIKVNARLVAATHRDLHREVEEKRFLEPLFYRLNVLPIHVPPLRERTEDLPVLVAEIMSKLASELQLPAMPVIDGSVIGALSEYGWPGNVRELRNVLEHSLILWHGGPFTLQMPWAQRPDEEEPHGQGADKEWSYVVRYSPDKGLDGVVEEVETSLYQHVLRIAQGKKNEAAKLLRISRGALYRYIKKWEAKGTT